MSEQMIVNRQLLKEVLLEMMQEQRNDFKALLREVLLESAPSMLAKQPPVNPLVGLFADDPQLVDDLIADIYADRQNIPFRAHG